MKRNFTRNILIVVALVLSFASTACKKAGTAQANDSSLAQESYQDLVGKYLLVSGGLQSAEAVISPIIDINKKESPNIPEDAWPRIKEIMIDFFKNNIVEMYAPIYKKHISENELRDIIKFYESPAGKKLADENPHIAAECMAGAEELGKRLNNEILQVLNSESYLKDAETNNTHNVSSAKDSYSKLLDEFFLASGTFQGLEASVDPIIEMNKKRSKNIPEDAWPRIKEIIADFFKNNIVEMYAPIYKKHISENELKEIIKFYESPAGKKLAEKNPAILTEAMAASEDLGQKLDKEISRVLASEGYLKN